MAMTFAYTGFSFWIIAVLASEVDPKTVSGGTAQLGKILSCTALQYLEALSNTSAADPLVVIATMVSGRLPIRPAPTRYGDHLRSQTLIFLSRQLLRIRSPSGTSRINVEPSTTGADFAHLMLRHYGSAISLEVLARASHSKLFWAEK